MQLFIYSHKGLWVFNMFIDNPIKEGLLRYQGEHFLWVVLLAIQFDTGCSPLVSARDGNGPTLLPNTVSTSSVEIIGFSNEGHREIQGNIRSFLLSPFPQKSTQLGAHSHGYNAIVNYRALVNLMGCKDFLEVTENRLGQKSRSCLSFCQFFS